MSPSDVMGEILAEPRLSQDDEGAALMTWGALVKQLKPGKEYLPMSPAEFERAKAILAHVQKALVTAHASNPAPLRPVEPGGR